MQEAALIPELNCTDIQKTLMFYIEVLGFKILYDRPESYFAMLERQGAQIMVEQINTGERQWLTGELAYPFGRGVNFQIQTKDINSLYRNIKKSKAIIFLDIEEKWYRADSIEVGNRQFIVQDPNGYLLRFFEDIGERPIQKTLD